MLPGRSTQRVRPCIHRAFTLAEVAIAMAVLALLAALILPALARAKQQSRASRCVDNTRHIGAAFAVYADNNNGEFVPFRKNETASRDALVDSGDPTATFWPDLLNEFAGDDGIWHCPACRGQFGIGYSQLLSRDSTQHRVTRTSDLAKPGATVIFGDTDRVANPGAAPDEWRPSETDNGSVQSRLQFEIPVSSDWNRRDKGSRRIWNRHLNRATVVFADQHAAVIPVSRLGFQEEVEISERLWDEN